MSFLNSAKNVCGNRVNQKFHKTLSGLKKDDSIRICSFDKGNGIVIVNKEEYYEKLDKIIYDKSKFKEVEEHPNKPHPVIQNENKIKNFLQKNVKGHIAKQEYERICPSGSQPGQLYGLCKAHKEDFPFRPVVSMINTAEHPLAQFLDEIIKPHIPSQHMVNSTSSFIQRLKTFCFSKSDILISFDVVSLFTNVPLTETIDMITERVYKSSTKPQFDKLVFKKLLEISTSGLFMYKNKLFRQIDGVSMGSPLGPTLANFCLAVFEEKLLSDNSNSSPSLYLRYVDDIFCVFRTGIPHDNFLDKLNNLHKNLQFTAELGPSSLAFLDTTIQLPTNEDDNNFTSSVYRKKTFTGLMLNFHAICPINWKLGLINCLLHRAYIISSTWNLFNDEADYLKNLFISNGYPVNLFYACLKRFLNKKHEKNGDRKVVHDGVEKVFSIPYVGLPSILFGKKLKRIFKDHYRIDLKIVFTTFKVKNYFSLKCRAPLPLSANVVYKFQCLRDVNKFYIGKTKRHLATRVREHGHASSAIHEHLNNCSACKHDYSIDSFRVIDGGNCDMSVSIKEAMHIKLKKPTLNKQLFNLGSSFVLGIF